MARYGEIPRGPRAPLAVIIIESIVIVAFAFCFISCYALVVIELSREPCVCTAAIIPPAPSPQPILPVFNDIPLTPLHPAPAPVRPAEERCGPPFPDINDVIKAYTLSGEYGRLKVVEPLGIGCYVLDRNGAKLGINGTRLTQYEAEGMIWAEKIQEASGGKILVHRRFIGSVSNYYPNMPDGDQASMWVIGFGLWR